MQQNDAVFWDLLPFPFWPSVKSLQRLLLYTKYKKHEKWRTKIFSCETKSYLYEIHFISALKQFRIKKNCSIKTLWFHPLKLAFKCIINVENWNVFFCICKMSPWFSLPVKRTEEKKPQKLRCEKTSNEM